MPPKGADEVSRIPKSVPLVRQAQAQKWSRTRSNFPQTQGPVARREFGHSLRFCAPEGFCQPQGISPVNGVLGGGEYGHEVSILSRSPSGSLVTFWPSRKSLAARGRRNLSAHNRPNPKSAPASVTASPCPPTPFGLRPFPPDRGNRPLDKGSRPPGEGLRATARVAPTAEKNRPRRQGHAVCACGRPKATPTDRARWFGKLRRRCETASAAIFAHPGPSGPD